ncbi:MAG TPA: fused MFS/spermidine synthase [Conexibacter sp.]|nr:fused MFS/spermidine synthase [Conexibacter sp.]
MPGRRLLLLLVFVVGASSLGGEIAAARLLAPWFGDSTLIWANTIATVLLALSAGYWLGGRLADQRPSVARLSGIVLAAAGLFALVPFVAGPFLRTSVEAFDSLSAGAFVGSLIAVLVLIAVPMLLLGTVAPYAIRLAVVRVEEAGSVAGRLYAVSTLGSLTGVFLSALVLIPFLGTRRTFLAFALALALVAVASMPRRWALAPAAVAALIAVPAGTVKATGDGRVIWERETPYQYARVVEASDGERRLELNEGQAVHSVYAPGRWLTGDYWDEFLVLPFAARERPPRSVAIVGNAAGTTARAYARYFPASRVDGVEIDGALSEVGRELFDLRGPRLHLHTADGRAFLRASERRWDAVFVDAYRQPYVPFHLATREFFALVRERLAPGGVVLVNVGHPERSDDLERALTATMRDVFAHVLRDPSQDTNTVLLATDGPVSADRLRAAVPGLSRELRPVAAAAAARLAPGLDGGSVFTDDRAPVEWLIDASIVEVAARGER